MIDVLPPMPAPASQPGAGDAQGIGVMPLPYHPTERDALIAGIVGIIEGTGSVPADSRHRYDLEAIADAELADPSRSMSDLALVIEEHKYPIARRVKRWDVYDIADDLADLPGMIRRVAEDNSAIGETWQEVYDLISDLQSRLWAAADRGGRVGSWPDYSDV